MRKLDCVVMNEVEMEGDCSRYGRSVEGEFALVSRS